jgi:hypothetical protein
LRIASYTRLRGTLENLGFDLGRSTIQRILTEHGIEPAPLRGRTMPWKTFLKAHWGPIAAADFFSVEVLTRRGLVRYGERPWPEECDEGLRRSTPDVAAA